MTTNQTTHPTRVEPAQRRRFTKTEKHQIVAEYDAASTPTEKGIVLRSWGTYQQNVSRWKRENQMTRPKQGSKPSQAETRLAKQLLASEKKLSAANDRVNLLEELVEAQGKVLGLHAKNTGSPSQE